MDLYALFQVSETNQMIILFVLLVMFIAVLYDIFTRIARLNKGASMIIAVSITLIALFSGGAIRAVHAILSLGAVFAIFSFYGTIALMFIAFLLLHFGLGRLAFWLRRRR